MKRIDGISDSLAERIVQFNQERGWRPIPQDIAKSIIIEAAELLEKFQWDGSSANLGTGSETKDWAEVGAELADVIWYVVTFSEATGLNLNEVLEKKLEANSIKYPVEKFNGKHNPEFYNKRKREYRKAKQ